MANKYILAIDQSTQGTKGMLFTHEGDLLARCDRAHEQKIDERGWVEHDPQEIIKNTLAVVRDVVEKAQIERGDISAVGISNQRETAMAWERPTGKPVYNAIVWQCARGEEICRRLEEQGCAKNIKERTGLHLSPYFSAAKLAWILENVDGAKEKAERGELCCGTMDSWLVYKLTNGKDFRTDYSNASRTQLFNVSALTWDKETCELFGIPQACLAQVCDSNSYFGETDFDGYLEKAIPIHAVLGDSHGALFGQGCLEKGMTKATYGTGSSVMMNIGEAPVYSLKGIVTSLAWVMDGKASYVLEGNINYTGAVISWLKNDLKLISGVEDAQKLPTLANPKDTTYFVPAFTGLGAPYWDSAATGLFTGITRVTGRAEFVRAAVDCIAYQISDIVELMRQEAGLEVKELRVDGGPTENAYLMQFQSDLLGIPVQVPNVQELSGMGAAYAAGIAVGLYDKAEVFTRVHRMRYERTMQSERREALCEGWKQAIRLTLAHKG